MQGLGEMYRVGMSAGLRRNLQDRDKCRVELQGRDEECRVKVIFAG